MTVESQIKKIHALSGADTSSRLIALRCIQASRILADTVTADDRVLWPRETGGLAWDALEGRRPKGPAGEGGRVFVVRPETGPTRARLWDDADKAALRLNRRIHTIGLEDEDVAGNTPELPMPSLDTVSSDRWIVRRLRMVLERLDTRRPENRSDRSSFPDPNEPLDRTTGTDLRNSLDSVPESLPLESMNDAVAKAGTPPVSSVLDDPEELRDWLKEQPAAFRIPSAVGIGESLLAAEASVLAGLMPIVDLVETGDSIDRDRSVTTAFLARMARRNRPVSILYRGAWRGLAPFRAIPDLSILTPASGRDLAGSMEWIRRSGNPAVVFHPGESSMPPRAVFKDPWETGRGVLVRENSGGTAGSILVIVPGSMAREASKAVDRLGKGNIRAKLLSMRFLSPIDTPFLRSTISECDLVVVAEAESFPGDLRTSSGMEFFRRGTANAVLMDDGLDGRALAEKTAAALRELRIKKTVDDVREDRWR